jgi:hypothetical protein
MQVRSGELIVPLRSKRRERAVLLQKTQHAAPGVMLLIAGLQSFGGGAHGFALALATFEIISSGLLLGTVGLAIRKARRPAVAEHVPHLHHGVDWIDIFAAGVLFAEAAERWHLTRHVARPTLLTAVVLLAVGTASRAHRPPCREAVYDSCGRSRAVHRRQTVSFDSIQLAERRVN